ncbi:MAG: hypothetical protein AAF531_21145 [Actinomycetota bacterium]
MPHLIIEHSNNIGDATASQFLVDRVHRAAQESPIVPAAGLRTRATARSAYRVADGREDNAFVAVVARLGPGRTAAEKSTFISLVLDVVEAAVVELAPDLVVSYSVEYQEIDAEFRRNRNHIRTRMEQEASDRPDAG